MRGMLLSLGILLFVVACGGSQEPSKVPENAEDDDLPIADDPKPEAKTDDVEQGGGEGAGGEEGKGGAKAPAADPEFKDGMSVDEAISAVPQGTPRVNVDQEELGKPLVNEALYKPCKMGPQSHFKLKVAVWDGKAVGIDVTAAPKNPKLEQCVKDQVKTVSWKNAVKSLNTVEYSH